MAVRKTSTATQNDDAEVIEANEANEDMTQFELQFVDELPPVTRGGGSGRGITPVNAALIERLKANPGKYAYVDVRKSGQPNRTLRNAGVLETFRKREDGLFDRYASYVGADNMPAKRHGGPGSSVREAALD
jgi:hypothetical protein